MLKEYSNIKNLASATAVNEGYLFTNTRSGVKSFMDKYHIPYQAQNFDLANYNNLKTKSTPSSLEQFVKHSTFPNRNPVQLAQMAQNINKLTSKLTGDNLKEFRRQMSQRALIAEGSLYTNIVPDNSQGKN